MTWFFLCFAGADLNLLFLVRLSISRISSSTFQNYLWLLMKLMRLLVEESWEETGWPVKFKNILLFVTDTGQNKLEFAIEIRLECRCLQNASSLFESIMFTVYGPHSWFWHKAKKQFLDQIWRVFSNKSKILTMLFIVKYEKITHFNEFLVLLGPIISSFFCMFKWGKINKQKQQKGARSNPISMVFAHVNFCCWLI